MPCIIFLAKTNRQGHPMPKRFLISLCILAIISCTPSGPQKSLDETAKAMEENNPSDFLANFDLKAYTTNHLVNLAENDKALSILNSLGSALGLGSIDNLINSFVDVEAEIREDFEMGVSTGELMATCKTATTPDCPWVPSSLRNASVIDLGADAAIAKITTPANLSCWLALHKIGGKWLIVGLAPLESQARSFAQKVPAQTPAKTVPAPKQKVPVSPDKRGAKSGPATI